MNEGLNTCVETKSQPTKQRYLELTELAIKTAIGLQEAGLKNEEQCEFGRIMEKIIRLN